MKISKFIIIFITTMLAWLMFIGMVLECHGAERNKNTYTKKTVSQSTSKENKIRKQMYDTAVKNGMSRSKAYYLYY